MNRLNKKALYESIMKNVAKQVKKALNEHNENILFTDPEDITPEEELSIVKSLSDEELMERAKYIAPDPNDWDGWEQEDHIDDWDWLVVSGYDINGWEFVASTVIEYPANERVEDIEVDWYAPDGRKGYFSQE